MTRSRRPQRADAIVYSVRYFDKEAYGGQGGKAADRAGADALEQISSETGGRLFEVSGKVTLEEVFAQIQEELRNQYSLGYTSSNHGGDGYRTSGSGRRTRS